MYSVSGFMSLEHFIEFFEDSAILQVSYSYNIFIYIIYLL